jgi:hypothetical protein
LRFGSLSSTFFRTVSQDFRLAAPLDIVYFVDMIKVRYKQMDGWSLKQDIPHHFSVEVFPPIGKTYLYRALSKGERETMTQENAVQCYGDSCCDSTFDSLMLAQHSKYVASLGKDWGAAVNNFYKLDQDNNQTLNLTPSKIDAWHLLIQTSTHFLKIKHMSTRHSSQHDSITAQQPAFTSFCSPFHDSTWSWDRHSVKKQYPLHHLYPIAIHYMSLFRVMLGNWISQYLGW